MGQIRDIMEKNVVTMDHNCTILDAAKLLKEKEISFAELTRDVLTKFVDEREVSHGRIQI